MFLMVDRVSSGTGYLGYFCGVAFCGACNVFTAWGVVTQKLVLKDETVGNGQLYYMKPRWLAAVAMMIVGQLLNIPALAFVPQTVVSILGGLSIVFNSILARAWLNEQLEGLQVMLMVAMILGASVVVAEMPAHNEVRYVDHIFGADNEPFVDTALTAVATLVSLGLLSTAFGSLKLIFLGLTGAACGSYSISFVKCCAQLVGTKRCWQDGHFYLLAIGALTIFVLQIAALQKGLRSSDVTLCIPVFFATGVVFTIFQAQVAFGELNGLQGWPKILVVTGVLLVICSGIALQMLHRERPKDECLPLLAPKGSASRGETA